MLAIMRPLRSFFENSIHRGTYDYMSVTLVVEKGLLMVMKK